MAHVTVDRGTWDEGPNRVKLERDLPSLRLKLRVRIGNNPESTHKFEENENWDSIMGFWFFLKTMAELRNLQKKTFRTTSAEACWKNYTKQLNASVVFAKETLPKEPASYGEGVGIKEAFRGLTGLVIQKARGGQKGGNWDD